MKICCWRHHHTPHIPLNESQSGDWLCNQKKRIHINHTIYIVQHKFSLYNAMECSEMLLVDSRLQYKLYIKAINLEIYFHKLIYEIYGLSINALNTHSSIHNISIHSVPYIPKTINRSCSNKNFLCDSIFPYIPSHSLQ